MSVLFCQNPKSTLNLPSLSFTQNTHTAPMTSMATTHFIHTRNLLLAGEQHTLKFSQRSRKCRMPFADLPCFVTILIVLPHSTWRICSSLKHHFGDQGHRYEQNRFTPRLASPCHPCT